MNIIKIVEYNRAYRFIKYTIIILQYSPYQKWRVGAVGCGKSCEWPGLRVL